VIRFNPSRMLSCATGITFETWSSTIAKLM
jgi:hypothetical protein